MTTSLRSAMRPGIGSASWVGQRTAAPGLRAQADAAAAEAVRSGAPVALPAMTARERRVVLDHLLTRIDVRVHAEGEGTGCHLLVVPVR